MATQLNGTTFASAQTRTFTPTFEGAQARRERTSMSFMTRRSQRRDRRANRAI